MARLRTALLFAPALVAACAGDPDRRTLAELRRMEPDVSEVRVENSLDQAMAGYQKFLEQAPESSLTPEAMRRLADLSIEKEYGLLGDGEIKELPAPQAAAWENAPREAPEPRREAPHARAESEQEFERRAASSTGFGPEDPTVALELPGGRQIPSGGGPEEAIRLYDQILAAYPHYQHNDEVLYQKARALDELGRVDEAVSVIERLTAEYPYSAHLDEVQFRRAEYFFTRRKFRQAEEGYAAVRSLGAGSEYYELALYKLGWTFYKQELHEEALHEYIALLDHKVSTGYDFDHAKDEDEERRIADTYRVVSLCFSNLGGPAEVDKYFAANGERSYEDRIYSRLAEFYLEKLRYQDAAASYEAFVSLHPLHRVAPHFSMRVVEVYEKGGFPKLVLESKKAFAASYGLQSEYWRHHDVAQAPEVRSYLKANLHDLAGHYHALYQNAERPEDKPAHFDEALTWYRGYLASFPAEPETPATHYRLADLLLEHRDFSASAREYERTAYDYPEHAQAAAAGYAAIFAHREQQKQASGDAQIAARRDAVASTLRFAERFPAHEHAATTLAAAVDDLYEMKEYALALATARKLIDGYPDSDVGLRRGAWTVVANASLDTANYPQAEQAYGQVLELTAEGDASRQTTVDNLAAAIYKQGEQANVAGDARAAADHFLRVAQAAPGSKIRPLAEYDASAALIALQDWSGAADVLESFREAHPEHELQRDATKQMAFVRKQEGDQTRAGAEYERVAAEAKDPEARREALLVAAELYENAKATERALAVHVAYVAEFPEPVETAVETRFKIASLQKAKGDDAAYREQLREIVRIDAAAAGARSARIRFLAAQSALVLSDEFFHRFERVLLVQPLEKNLQEKQRRMDEALAAFGKLVDYEVADVTAAATYYMAEIFAEFSRALLDSERPGGLDAAELAEYTSALEGEAFPFEERAIDVHEKNLELMAAGVYNPWIDKSLERLAALVPGRYAKFETSSGLIASLDGYAYETPKARTAAPAPAPEPAPAQVAPAPEVPAALEEGAGDGQAP